MLTGVCRVFVECNYETEDAKPSEASSSEQELLGKPAWSESNERPPQARRSPPPFCQHLEVRDGAFPAFADPNDRAARAHLEVVLDELLDADGNGLIVNRARVCEAEYGIRNVPLGPPDFAGWAVPGVCRR